MLKLGEGEFYYPTVGVAMCVGLAIPTHRNILMQISLMVQQSKI